MTEPIKPEIVPAERSWRQLVWEATLLLPNLVKLLSRMIRDPRVPRRRKLVAGVVMGYLVSPIDLIPDIVPVLGQADDVLLVAFAIRHLMEGAGDEIVLEHWDGDPDLLEIIDTLLQWGSDLLPKPVRRFLT